MAERKVTQRRMVLQWIFGAEHLMMAPATAAEKIGVHEKHIFRLVNEGHLERLVITDNRGRELGRGITVESVDAYLRKDRKRRQRTLPLGAVD